MCPVTSNCRLPTAEHRSGRTWKGVLWVYISLLIKLLLLYLEFLSTSHGGGEEVRKEYEIYLYIIYWVAVRNELLLQSKIYKMPINFN